MEKTYYDGDASFHDVSNMTQDNANQHLTSNDVHALIERANKLHDDISNELSCETASDVDYVQIELWAKEIDILTKRIDNLPIENFETLRAKIAFYLSEIEHANGDAINLSTYKEKIMSALSSEAVFNSHQDVQKRA